MDKKELLTKLKKLAEKKKKVLTTKDIQSEGLHSTLYQYYDSVADALEEAGLEATTLAKRMRMTDEEKLRNLYELGKRIGRTPRHKDIRKEGWYKIYKKFGSVKKAYELALVKFGSPEKRERSKVTLPEINDKGDFYGAAGEYFVITQLLYWGFIAQKMPVDLGLDVYATKGEKIFFFQVKHVSFDRAKIRHVPITSSSFLRNESSRVFYVFVIQEGTEREALIINYQIMIQLRKEGYIRETSDKKIAISFKKVNNSIFVFDTDNKDRRKDMGDYLDDWGAIV